MENRKDNHLSAILEYPFDFDRYIEERLREIDDSDERQYAKKILAEGLGKLIHCTESKYRQLEKRVYEELETWDSQYETVMTIVRREHYDPTNRTLYPVIEEDLKEDALAEQLSDESQIWTGTIFLKAGEQEQRKFERHQSFDGIWSKDGERQEASFHIRPAKRYRDVIERLYQVFQDNHVPWETINTAYLDKFYDVYISAEETENRRLPIAIKDAGIDFGEFKEAVHCDLIPLWNMEWVGVDSADFMLPSIDGIYYEHEITLEEKTEEDGYLIEANEDILEIRHEKTKIVMKSRKGTFEGWRVLHIIQKEPLRSLDYDAPLVGNHKRDSFLRRFAEHSRVQLLTKADLFRRIMELDIRDYVEVVNYEICAGAGNEPGAESMNWFIQEELFPMDSRRLLLLNFKEREPGNYLNGSMVRFAISQIQLEISEYRCVGVII
ncbi:MAG: hypothetical protein LBT06_07580 [Hungatella sp.]|jgi:hypothetical protein|nr:hypothetical protein [Hungatella sp.]